jgi:hypothetical protein
LIRCVHRTEDCREISWIHEIGRIASSVTRGNHFFIPHQSTGICGLCVGPKFRVELISLASGECHSASGLNPSKLLLCLAIDFR